MNVLGDQREVSSNQPTFDEINTSDKTSTRMGIHHITQHHITNSTQKKIMGRTFQSLSWVRVGSAGEEDDAPAYDDDDNAPDGGGGGGGTLGTKWRNRHISKKRSLVIHSPMGR